MLTLGLKWPKTNIPFFLFIHETNHFTSDAQQIITMPWLIPIAVLMHCENGAFDTKQDITLKGSHEDRSDIQEPRILEMLEPFWKKYDPTCQKQPAYYRP